MSKRAVVVAVCVRVSMTVRVIVACVVWVFVVVAPAAEGRAQACGEQTQAEDENDRAGGEAEDWEERFGQHVLRSEEGYETEREDAGGVRGGDRQPEKRRVLR